MHPVWSLAALQFKATRNYFFEKYSFLNSREPMHKFFYMAWYVAKNQLLTAFGLTVVASFLNLKEVGALIGLAFLIIFLFQSDIVDWKLFTRNDVVLAYPKISKRFVTILLRNLIVKFILEQNIALLVVAICLLLDFSPIKTVVVSCALVVTVALLFLSGQAYYFVWLHSSLRTKKMISTVQYVTNITVVVALSIMVIEGVVDVVSFAVGNIKTREEFIHYLLHGINLAALGGFLEHNLPVILLSATLVSMAWFAAAAYWLHSIAKGAATIPFEYKARQGRVNNFGVLRLLIKVPSPHNNALLRSLLDKEFQFFAAIYSYKFKDYPYIFCIDRPTCFLAIVGYFLLKYPSTLSAAVFFTATISMLILNIDSASTTKLSANMSFAGDYNTLRLFNGNNMNLNLLYNAKLRFFYTVKAFSFLIYFLIFNITSCMLRMNYWLVLLLNIICLYVVFTFPRLYFSNNLIYMRVNYRDTDALLTDESLTEARTQEFFPLRVSFQIEIAVFLLFVALAAMTPTIDTLIPLISIIAIRILLFSVLHFTMKQIHTNIFAFIERGDYSVNFAKVFRQRKDVAHR